jgi:pyrroloquinoline quinone biosynthesis protein B
LEITRRQFLASTAIATTAALRVEGVEPARGPFAVVLGTAQDGGFPQAGCKKVCCKNAWGEAAKRRDPASLGIIDPISGQRWFVECTPSFPRQARRFDAAHPKLAGRIDGILLTHAHMGHYAGLLHLGREVMGADGVPVHAMPRMEKFLRTQGPWSQLVQLKNIALRPMRDGRAFVLNKRLRVTPFLVPHRDEFSETVGFRIEGPRQKILWLPDIDKWERWETPLEKALAGVDVAYLDATFYADGELPGRDMSKIPHPFIAETMRRLKNQPAAVRAKVRFIHLNHTNPAHDPRSAAAKAIRAAGFRVAEQGERVEL